MKKKCNYFKIQIKMQIRYGNLFVIPQLQLQLLY